MLTTEEAAQLLSKKGIKLIPKQIAQLAQNGVFPNAKKGTDQRWKIPEDELIAFLKLRQKRRRIITASTITFIITVLGIISVTNDAFGLIDRIYPHVTPTKTYMTQLLYDGCKLLENKEYKKAEEKFNLAKENDSRSPEPWYWKAKISEANDNKLVAIEYVDKAITISPQHFPSVVLKIELLLTSAENESAKKIANQSFGITKDLDRWLSCLENNNFFSPNIVITTEINSSCQTPSYSCETIGK